LYSGLNDSLSNSQTAAPQSSSSSNSVKDEKIAQLVEMGFDVESATKALAARNGDERAALNDLLGM